MTRPTFLSRQTLERVRSVLGKEPPDQNTVQGLSDIPDDILKDVALIYEKCGSLYAFAFLYHVSDAEFGEVKTYVSDRCWRSNMK